MEQNTVIISTNEYQELLKYKLLVTNSLNQCFATQYNYTNEVQYFYPIDSDLLEVLLPEAAKMAQRRALENLEEKEQK